MNYHKYKSNHCPFLPKNMIERKKNLMKEKKDNNSSYMSDLGEQLCITNLFIVLEDT